MKFTFDKNGIYIIGEELKKASGTKHFDELMEDVFKAFDDQGLSQKNKEDILNDIFNELEKDKEKDKFIEFLNTQRSVINIDALSNIVTYQNNKGKTLEPESIAGPDADAYKATSNFVPGKGWGTLKNPFRDKIVWNNVKIDKNLTLDGDGPEYLKYVAETDKLKAELENIKNEKEKLVNLANTLKTIDKIEDLKTLKEDLTKPENNYTDKYKSIATQLIANRERILNNIKTLPKPAYDDIINKMEAIVSANPTGFATDTTYIDLQAKKEEYEKIDSIITKILNGKLPYNDYIEIMIDNSSLEDIQRDELKTNLKSTVSKDINYDNYIETEYQEDLKNREDIISIREDNIQIYKNVIKKIRLIQKDNSKKDTEIPKIENYIDLLKNAPELKEELLKFVKKYLIFEGPKVATDEFKTFESEIKTIKKSDVDDIDITRAGRKLDPTAAPEFEKYKLETENLKKQKANLEALKVEYDGLLEKIKNAMTVAELEALKPEIENFTKNTALIDDTNPELLNEADVKYFSDTLNTIYADKENKLNGVSNNFDTKGEKYETYENEMKGLPDGDARKNELQTWLKNYDDVLERLKFIVSAGLDINIEGEKIIDGYSDTDLSPDLKDELKGKIKARTTDAFLEEEELINSYDNDINTLTKNIQVREEHIELYKSIREKIRDLGAKIKNKELKKDSEETKSLVDEINKEMEPLPKELKEELTKLLALALNQKKRIVEVFKRKDLLTKVLTGIAGFAVGAVIGYVASLPITLAALGLSVGGAILTGRKSKKIKNEIQKIEEIDKPTKEQLEELAKLKRNNKILEHATWGLSGAAIGLAAGHVYKYITTPKVQHTPNFKVGDTANGMDLQTGYDTPNMALNGTNPEALNQGIMNDGNTVIRRIMDSQGNTYMSTEEAIKAGKSYSELTFDLAKGTNMDNTLSRAWVNVDTATKPLRP